MTAAPAEHDADVVFESGEVADVMPPMAPQTHRLSAVLWPAFLMAGVMEMLVFAMVDPGDLHWLGGASVELDRKGIYTIAFFMFWVIISLASALTQLVMIEPNIINKPYRNHL